MRHNYHTTGIVISRAPFGEASALTSLLTRELGLVRARAQGVRKSGAKLAAPLATFNESEFILVRGKEGWRVTGGVLLGQWGRELEPAARVRAARIAGLLLRLQAPEAIESSPYEIFREALTNFVHEPADLHEAVECRAVLRLLASLGLDTGAIPDLPEAKEAKSSFVTRINRGITLSGL